MNEIKVYYISRLFTANELQEEPEFNQADWEHQLSAEKEKDGIRQ